LLPKFLSENAATTHELRKRGTSRAVARGTAVRGATPGKFGQNDRGWVRRHPQTGPVYLAL